MSVSDQLLDRNDRFASTAHDPALRMMPTLRTIVIACVDPRVDPETVLGVTLGEVAVIRNVGGRVTPGVLDELALLRDVTRAAGGDLGSGWELIVLQHLDCGITRLPEDSPGLAAYLGVEVAELAACHVGDPAAAVARDVELLRADDRLGAGIVVSGLLLDVADGRVTRVTTG